MPSRRLLMGVAGYAGIVAGLEVTNPFHHFARTGYEIVGETVPHVVGTPTTAYTLLTLPSFVAYYAAMGILGYRFLVRREGRWKQTTVLFVGFLAPFVVSSLWFTGTLPGPINGAFVIGSSWMAAFAGWAVFRYQLFDVVPLAREAAFGALDERVIVTDSDVRLLDYNESAVETFPVLAGNKGKPLGDLLPALVDESRPRGAGDADGDATPSPFVSAFTGYDESNPREYTVTTSRLRADGRTQGYAALVRDITDRQRQIRDLEQQKAQLERFASTLSHDIRNPLNVARGRTELAMESDDTDNLDHVLDALDRIEGIIDDLLTLSREGRTIDDRERVSLAEVARDAWRTTGTGEARLDVEVDPHVSVYADRTRLLNAFENLFRNSVEHGGPAVTVTLGRHDDGFYVEDDGPGIPPEERESVFEYEYTTAGGTGLGLAIVDAIAQAHGWTTDAREGSDGGARIVFSDVKLVDDTDDAAVRDGVEGEGERDAEAAGASL
ncbi:MAG: ATP-binding protein [Haloplanus sp.]